MNYHWKRIYFDNDPANGGAGDQKPNFDALEDAFSDENAINPEDIKTELKPGDPGYVAPALKPGDPGYVEPAKGEPKPGDPDYKEDDEPIFKLPGDEGYEGDPPNIVVPGSEDNEASTWIEIAEAQGIKIEEDSMEAYVEAVKKDREEAILLAKEEAKKEQFQFDVAKYPEKERLYLEHVLNGGSIDDFNEPTKQIDNYLSMDNERLITEDLKARGYSETMVAAEIALRKKETITINEGKENEQVITKLDLDAERIKSSLKTKRETIILETIEGRKAIKEREEKIRQDTINAENTKFKEELGRTETFFGIPVSQAQKDFIVKQWESGALRKLFAENPNVAVKAAMQHYFGDQALKLIKTMEYDAGADRFRRKLSNVPIKKPEAGGRVPNSAKTSGGDGPNFEILEESLS